MATTMEDVMTEIGIEKFIVSVTVNDSVKVNALSIFAGKKTVILLFIREQRI